MSTNVITITREFGSMGRPIAKAVAKKIGYEYYDRDIIDQVVTSSNMPVEKYLQMNDKPLSAYDRMMYPLGIGDAAKQDSIFQLEKDAMLKMAKKQDCVIVGRCADYIMSTANRPNVLSVFIYAPLEARKEFCKNKLGIKPEKVDDYIIRVDRGRSEYYKRQTGEEFNSQKYRNLMIDSSCADMDEIVELISQLAKYKFHL